VPFWITFKLLSTWFHLLQTWLNSPWCLIFKCLVLHCMFRLVWCCLVCLFVCTVCCWCLFLPCTIACICHAVNKRQLTLYNFAPGADDTSGVSGVRPEIGRDTAECSWPTPWHWVTVARLCVVTAVHCRQVLSRRIVAAVSTVTALRFVYVSLGIKVTVTVRCVQ